MNPEYFWRGPMWVFPIIMPVVMLAALVLCLYFMFGGGGSSWQQPGALLGAAREVETPLDILRRRYAKGEISKGEYEQIKRDLQS